MVGSQFGEHLISVNFLFLCQAVTDGKLSLEMLIATHMAGLGSRALA